MSIASLSNLSPIWQPVSVSSSSTASQTASLSAVPQDCPPQLSKLATSMKELETLQQTDPETFKQVAGEIATKLQDAAKSASDSGDTHKADQFNKLADQFKTASEDGKMPQLHKGHHGHHSGGTPPPTGGGDHDGDADDKTTSNTTATSSVAASKYQEVMEFSRQNSGTDMRSSLSGIIESALRAKQT